MGKVLQNCGKIHVGVRNETSKLGLPGPENGL